MKHFILGLLLGALAFAGAERFITHPYCYTVAGGKGKGGGGDGGDAIVCTNVIAVGGGAGGGRSK